MKNQVSGWWPLCDGQQVVDNSLMSHHLFSQRLHTRHILRIAVDGKSEDGGDDLHEKQRKESPEDQLRSIIHCPYAEHHHDCSNH